MTRDPGFVDHEGTVIDFGRTASDYERHRPGFPDSFFDRVVELGWLAAGQKAMDLGTGTGTLALGLASRGLDVIGLDIAPELLSAARHSAADQGLSIRFIEGRAEVTGQAEGRFDLVTAGQCWWWFDTDQAVAEAMRVLTPGGRLLICNFSYLPLAETVTGRTEALILRYNPDWPKAGWRGVHPEQVRALDEGGFCGVESFSYTVDVPFTHEGWRGRMRTCNGVGASLAEDQVGDFDNDLAKMLASEFPDDLIIPHRVFATSGIRPWPQK